MTGFEKWMEATGHAELVSGSKGEFSTYGNVERTWLFGDLKIPIQVGLIRVGEHNMIAVRHPIVTYIPQTEADMAALIGRVSTLNCDIDAAYFIKDNNE